jgi:radical SAM-linked protein
MGRSVDRTQLPLYNGAVTNHDLSTLDMGVDLTLGPEVTVAPRQRLRITYAKGEAVKFISHHDEFRLWERALRRADLPLLYKQGFNPQPHMQFASPLGVGFTGAREWLDIVLSPPVPPAEAASRLGASLPPGVTVLDVAEVPLKAPALQGVLIGADYTILLYAVPGEVADGLLEGRIAGFLARREIWRARERKGERYTYNLRPLVFELRYAGYDVAREEHRIFLRVQQRAGATGRPDEVVDALGLDDFARTLRRERLYCSDKAEDAAIFAQYPEVTQAEVAGPRPERPHSVAGATVAPVRRGGRSISERAGDEFV